MGEVEVCTTFPNDNKDIYEGSVPRIVKLLWVGMTTPRCLKIFAEI